MINRANYLEQLKPFICRPLIKVITGLRRSGKSTVMKLLRAELLSQGVSDEHIIYINFESFAFNEIKSAEQLYTFVKDKLISSQKYYLLLDEIQEVDGWEKAVNAFLVDIDSDIYITGSNSRLLSSDLATYLAGRYVEIPIFTLSYQEFLDFKAEYTPSISSATPPNISQLFEEYLHKGGFPMAYLADYSQETVYKIVQDIYASVILRDTVQRYKIRDIELLERVVKYAFTNIGNTFSGKNIADYFKSQQRKVDNNTVYNYLEALASAFILHRVERFNIKGKEILKTQEKFYLGDVSLLHALMGFHSTFIAGILENLVYLELKRRGYQVYVGKLDTLEIDFIAQKREQTLYIQVAYKLENEQTIAREFAPLQRIKDNYPKYVVSMDADWHGNIDGIIHQTMWEFLLSDAY